MTARARSLLLLSLAGLVLSPAGARDRDYEIFFKNGMRALIGNRFNEAAVFFSYAVDRNPHAFGRPRIVLHGERRVPYMPHFFLGAALFEVGNYEGALKEWKEARDQGIVLRSRRYGAMLEEAVAFLGDEILSDALEHLEQHLEASEPSLDVAAEALSSVDPPPSEVMAELARVEQDLSTVRSRWQSAVSTSASPPSGTRSSLDRLDELEVTYRELADLESLAQVAESDLDEVYSKISRLVVAQLSARWSPEPASSAGRFGTVRAGGGVRLAVAPSRGSGHTVRANLSVPVEGGGPTETALSQFVSGAVLVATENCDLIQLMAVPYLESAFGMSDALKGSSLDGRTVSPALELARAYMHCDDAARVEHYLRQVPDRSSTGSEYKAVEAWLRAPKAERYQHKYAILVAASKYDDWPSIPGPVKDLAAVRPALEELGFEVVAEIIDPMRYPDGKALPLDRQVIEAGKKLVEPNSLLLFYYAGHGLSTEGRHTSSEGWIVPVDAPVDEETFLSELAGYSMDTLSTWIQGPLRQPMHQIYLFDSCFSGEAVSSARRRYGEAARRQAFSHLSSTRGGRVVDRDRSAKEEELEQVTVVLSAGTAEERVPDDSVFRRHLVDVLAGRTAADLNRDGAISSVELAGYVSELVSTEVSQTPVFVEFPEGGRIVFDVGPSVAAPSSGEPTLSMSEVQLLLLLEINNWHHAFERDDATGYYEFCRKYPEENGHFRAIARASLQRHGSPAGDCAAS